ncbi:MAG: hypothetical protein GTN62_05740 [Gemmatimonadales bacterium]|nr:hypothetical protein [Gemmatimonadales bacterium]NIN11001.1 hypothetical protein [Gemmatimonadales bacterium]NIN49598.1 hypothetical protein [Gemmatimonadales bacterium]NIP07062.1 hypothetical protein [Gemmatimonadales bacterium]NIQ99453.1 hypothetical protein [Gemmatimonadales bacterium]
MVEDAVDLLGSGDESDYAHLLAASGTGGRVDFGDVSQQLGPTPAGLAQRVGLRVDAYDWVFVACLGGLAALRWLVLVSNRS